MPRRFEKCARRSAKCCAGLSINCWRSPPAVSSIRSLLGGPNMTMLTNRPMSLFFVEFDELCARHLCRHSQLGINVIHLLALLGIWYALYGLLYWLVGVEWALVAAALAYLAILVINVPMRVFLAA